VWMMPSDDLNVHDRINDDQNQMFFEDRNTGFEQQGFPDRALSAVYELLLWLSAIAWLSFALISPRPDAARSIRTLLLLCDTTPHLTTENCRRYVKDSRINAMPIRSLQRAAISSERQRRSGESSALRLRRAPIHRCCFWVENQYMFSVSCLTRRCAPGTPRRPPSHSCRRSMCRMRRDC
jgi:hypothetical protein